MKHLGCNIPSGHKMAMERRKHLSPFKRTEVFLNLFIDKVPILVFKSTGEEHLCGVNEVKFYLG